MPIRLKRDTEDGLDPVFEAYEQLRRIYGAARYAGDDCRCEEPCPCDDYIILPGTNETVNINDINELKALEQWLGEEVARRTAEGDIVRKAKPRRSADD